MSGATVRTLTPNLVVQLFVETEPFVRKIIMSLACPSFIASLDPALCRAVDHYCERTSEAWSAEPINAVSNAAFLIAGFAAWWLAKQRKALVEDTLLAVLLVIIPAIGIGSFIFHVIATRWTEWIDVIPILVFMLLYLWLAMSRFIGFLAPFRVAALLAFFAATFAIEAWVPASVLWGGAMYLPAIVALVVIGLMANRWTAGTRALFLLAIATFMVSFAMRTADASLCPALPFGTHFLWHIFNAATVYLLARAAIIGKVS